MENKYNKQKMSIIEEKKIKRPLDDIDLQLNQKMAKSVLLNGENKISLDYQSQRLGRQTMVIKMDKQHNIRVSDLDFVDIDERRNVIACKQAPQGFGVPLHAVVGAHN